MSEFFSELTSWHWLVFGVALMAIEAFVPGAFFLWPGLAALLVGVASALLPLPWTVSVTAWAVLSVISVTGWVFYRKKHPATASENGLNERGREFIGKTLTLESAVINGKGQVHAGDTIWKVVSDQDISAGTAVKVTGIEGIALKIEPKNQ